MTSARGLADLITEVERHGRVALDTEADSLHCYREKLCLLQISLPADGRWIGLSESASPARTDAKTNVSSSRGATSRSRNAIHPDFIVDPLANVDLAPLRDALVSKEYCAPWLALRSAIAASQHEFRAKTDFLYRYRRAHDRHSRIQFGCVGETLFRC